MEKCTFHYEENYDRLFVSRKKDDEKVYGSVRVLNLIIDFAEDNRAVGFEILQVSNHLKSLGVDQSILSKLTGVEVSFREENDGYLINFNLYFDDKVERVPYNIIIEKPLVVS